MYCCNWTPEFRAEQTLAPENRFHRAAGGRGEAATATKYYHYITGLAAAAAAAGHYCTHRIVSSPLQQLMRVIYHRRVSGRWRITSSLFGRKYPAPRRHTFVATFANNGALLCNVGDSLLYRHHVFPSFLSFLFFVCVSIHQTLKSITVPCKGSCWHLH